jgi:hypothetical protein
MRRRSMPVTDLTSGRMHSDGEFTNVRSLVLARIRPLEDFRQENLGQVMNSLGVEMNPYGLPVGGKVAVVPVADRLAADGFYARAFRDAFGDETPTIDRVADAVEAYVYSLRTGANALDRFLAGDDAALAPPARRGLALFAGRAGCAQCHVVTPRDGRAPLRDELYHDIGIAWRTALAEGTDSPRRDADQGRGAHMDRAAQRRSERMRFKTPSLRDVARRGPYMHDGSLRTLIDVIDYFDRGGARHNGLDAAIRPLGLSEDEKSDLLAFLLALSSPERAGLAPASARKGGTTTIRVVAPDGKPLAGAAVGIEPAGDRLAGAAELPAAIAARTDDRGSLTFAFPKSTHVLVRVAGHGVAGGGLVPDVAGDVELVAVPQQCVAIRVIGDCDGLPREVHATPAPVFGVMGRPGPPMEGDPIDFRLACVRSSSDGYYVARLPANGAGSARRQLLPKGEDSGAFVSQADLDLRGGAITCVDLRPLRSPAQRQAGGDDRR